MQKAMP